MVRRFLVGIAVAVGLFSIAIGVQRWFDAHAAASVVQSLMNAVLDGDRTTALSLLSVDRRSLVDTPLSLRSPASRWRRQTGVTYEILDIEIRGDTATARVKLEKDDYALEPVVHLRRSKTNRWKVDLVKGLEVDPRYLLHRKAYERCQGEQLAGRLQQALNDRRGVSVKRLTTADLPGNRVE